VVLATFELGFGQYNLTLSILPVEVRLLTAEHLQKQHTECENFLLVSVFGFRFVIVLVAVVGVYVLEFGGQVVPLAWVLVVAFE